MLGSVYDGYVPLIGIELETDYIALRGDSTTAVRSGPLDDGGSTPTSPLQRLRKADWTVATADMDVAKRIVRRWHYAKGASNTMVHIHGLFPSGWSWHEQCVGVAWWIPPTRSAAENWAGDRWEGVLALSRLAIDPSVPANACSFLISRSVKMIDKLRWHTLVSYADSWRGHTGAIYRAAGWEYSGETQPEATYTIRGRMTSRKTGSKTRTHSEMLQLGAVFVGAFSKSRFVLRR